MLKYMLDTNIVIYVIKHKPIQVAHIFNQNAGKMCVSSITVSALYYGAEKSQFPEKNLRTIEDFLARLEILPYSEKAAIHSGNIKANLAEQSILIGENDIHISAHARSEGLILVTNNLREFKRVEGLRLENWV